MSLETRESSSLLLRVGVFVPRGAARSQAGAETALSSSSWDATDDRTVQKHMHGNEAIFFFFFYIIASTV